jgi:hypothetical protein
MIGSAPVPRKWLVAAIAVVALAGLAVAWRKLQVSALAEIGAGYAAEQTCACIFISGRASASCRADLDPLARWLVSVRSTGAEVTANAFGVARATARYDKDFGCTLED